jgi:hypothetical protein
LSLIHPPCRPVRVGSHGGLILAIVVVVVAFITIVVDAAVIMRFLLPLAFNVLVGHVQHVPANVAPHLNMTMLLKSLSFISFVHFGFGGRNVQIFELFVSVN